MSRPTCSLPRVEVDHAPSTGVMVDLQALRLELVIEYDIAAEPPDITRANKPLLQSLYKVGRRDDRLTGDGTDPADQHPRG